MLLKFIKTDHAYLDTELGMKIRFDIPKNKYSDEEYPLRQVCKIISGYWDTMDLQEI